MIKYVLFSVAVVTQLAGISWATALTQPQYLFPSHDERNIITTKMLPVVRMRPMPQRRDTDNGPSLSAKSAMVIDATSHAILWEKNADQPLPIASITKLMTALVVADVTTDWSTAYAMRSEDVAYGGSKFYASAGDEFTRHDLLKTSLIASANNAAAALAHSIGLSDEDFAAAMNAKALSLGMTHSQFVEPTGLSAGNTATVGDVALLMNAAAHDPVIRSAMQQVEHRLKRINNPDDATEILVHTTDELLKDQDPYVQVGKTGFTYEAGNCLTTLAKNEQGNELVTVVLGAPDPSSRFTETSQLVRWTYEHYTWPE